jgi:hypothetical protein
MARTPKAADNMQIFRGSLARPDVFALAASEGCCPGGTQVTHDKLAQVAHFDNALSHLNPLGGNEKVTFPDTQWDRDRQAIIDWINEHGVGASFSVALLPTYSWFTDLSVLVLAQEAGLTFDVITRNGASLPSGQSVMVTATGSTCNVTRTQEEGGNFTGIGALAEGELHVLHIARDEGNFVLEADEVILQVATMPAGGVVTGTFRLQIGVSYHVNARAPL